MEPIRVAVSENTQGRGIRGGPDGVSVGKLALKSTLLFLALAALLAGCDLTPTRPDAVFILYRDRMKAENLEEARSLITDQSKELAVSLESRFQLKQPPEDLALLNALDPIAAPTIAELKDKAAILNARAMKGTNHPVKLVKNSSDGRWKVDLSEELASLRAFLEARQALEMVREQAGEFAASWKAFNEQLGKMEIPETPPPKPEPAPAKPHKTPAKKGSQKRH